MNTISLLVSVVIIGFIIYFVYKTQSEDKESSIVRADVPEIPKKKTKPTTKSVVSEVKSDTKSKKSSPRSPKKTTTKK
jgi:hypothetical protein